MQSPWNVAPMAPRISLKDLSEEARKQRKRQQKLETRQRQKLRDSTPSQALTASTPTLTAPASAARLSTANPASAFACSPTLGSASWTTTTPRITFGVAPDSSPSPIVTSIISAPARLPASVGKDSLGRGHVDMDELIASVAALAFVDRQVLERDFECDVELFDEDVCGDAAMDNSTPDMEPSSPPTELPPPAATSPPAAPAEPAPLDHRGRPYYNEERYPTARSYISHRLGASPERLAALPSPYTRGDERYATLADVMSTRPPAAWNTRIAPTSIIWPKPDTKRDYNLRSIALQGVVPQDVIDAALRHLPSSIYPPSPATTKEEMVEQLATCPELDDIHVLEHGSGKDGKRVRLNGTAYRQPRRISWSVVWCDRVWSEKHQAYLMGFFSYSQSYRLPEDWRARLMPYDVFALGDACWRATFDELTSISQQCPPTGCQPLCCT